MSVKCGDFFFFSVASIQHPKLESDLFQIALIFVYASKGCCIFSEVLSTRILDWISSIYRVLRSLGDQLFLLIALNESRALLEIHLLNQAMDECSLLAPAVPAEEVAPPCMPQLLVSPPCCRLFPTVDMTAKMVV